VNYHVTDPGLCEIFFSINVFNNSYITNNTLFNGRCTHNSEYRMAMSNINA